MSAEAKPKSPQGPIPVGVGLFTLPAEGQAPNLIGMKCLSCGEVVFPKRRRCPKCTKGDLEEVKLSRTGTLFSFSTVRVRLPSCHVEPPFVVGVIELPEGERIRSLLKDCTQETLKIGQKMELVIEPVYKDETGADVLGWKFKPAGGPQ